MSPTPHTNPVLVWFREDLRLSDNPALTAAINTGSPVAALFVLDEVSEGFRSYGGASRWWLHHSLSSLMADLSALGIELILKRGLAAEVLNKVAKEINASAVFWNRRYRKAEVDLDTTIKASLKDSGIGCNSFNGKLLVEPWEVTTQSGTPMKVFTPFWKNARLHSERFGDVITAPTSANAYTHNLGDRLEDWQLLPTQPDWSHGLQATWQPGALGARKRLDTFLSEGLSGYGEDRDRPDLDVTSRLSPHLKFGEISPRQIWKATLSLSSTVPEEDISKFRAELGWREFSYHLLFNNPGLDEDNFQPKFDAFPWRDSAADLKAWQQGMTGYPIVDAGMRQLYKTGWMHNRVRMVVGSFLVKHLLIDWRHGEDWFWDTLVDADVASNPASWQWISGSGADAAPYFRVFNPITQGEKFDPNGEYIRKFVPELSQVPNKFIHKPWEAPEKILSFAGVELGKTYPKPVVEHKHGRERALSAFQSLAA